MNNGTEIVILMQMRHSQVFGILADCGALGGRMLLTLVTSHGDGSFDMRPGMSQPGSWYRQQDKAGVCLPILLAEQSNVPVHIVFLQSQPQQPHFSSKQVWFSCCCIASCFTGVLWEWHLELEPGDVEVIPRSALLDFGPPNLSKSAAEVMT